MNYLQLENEDGTIARWVISDDELADVETLLGPPDTIIA